MVRIRPVFGLPLVPRGCLARGDLRWQVPWQQLKGGMPLELVNKIRAGFLLHGVDIAAWPGGFASAAHTAEDVARTVAAFEATFDMLAAEGALVIAASALRPTRTRYKVLLFVYFAAFITYLDRVCMSVAAPVMQARPGALADPVCMGLHGLLHCLRCVRDTHGVAR